MFTLREDITELPYYLIKWGQYLLKYNLNIVDAFQCMFEVTLRSQCMFEVTLKREKIFKIKTFSFIKMNFIILLCKELNLSYESSINKKSNITGKIYTIEIVLGEDFDK